MLHFLKFNIEFIQIKRMNGMLKLNYGHFFGEGYLAILRKEHTQNIGYIII